MKCTVRSLFHTDHLVELACAKGCLCIVVSANVFTLHENAWNGALPRHSQEFSLDECPVFRLIEFVDGNINVGHGSKELFCLCAVWAVALAPDDHIVALVLALDEFLNLL